MRCLCAKTVGSGVGAVDNFVAIFSVEAKKRRPVFQRNSRCSWPRDAGPPLGQSFRLALTIPRR